MTMLMGLNLTVVQMTIHSTLPMRRKSNDIPDSLDALHNVSCGNRTPVAPAADISAMRSILTGMGFTLSQLNDVTQEGCTYKKAFIKK